MTNKSSIVTSSIIGAIVGISGSQLLDYEGPKAIAIEKVSGPSIVAKVHDTCLSDIESSLSPKSNYLQCEVKEVDINQQTEEHWLCRSDGGGFGAITTLQETCIQNAAGSIATKSNSIECDFKKVEVDGSIEDRWVCMANGYEEKEINDLALGQIVRVIKKE